MIAYSVFGPSRVLAIGPDSATAPLVGAAIIPLALAGSSHRIALAGMLALLVGGAAVLVGAARLGFVTELISRPVRVGYMNGLALIILVSQLPKLFGFRVGADGAVPQALEFASRVGGYNAVALALGVGALVVIVVLRAVSPRIPGILVAAIPAAAVTAVFGLADRFGVPVVGVLPAGLPVPAWPMVSLQEVAALVPAAAAIAVMTLTDTTVLSRVFAAREGYAVDPNQEIVAIGAANIAAGLFQGMPTSGSQSRSAVSISSGARSQLAGLIGAIVLAMVLVFAPWLFSNLPTSVLAAIVIVAGLSLTDYPGVTKLWRYRRTEFALSLGTFVGVILLGVLPGVLVAVGLSLLNFVRRLWRPHDAVLGRAPGVKGYHDVGDLTDARQIPGLLLYRYDAPLFFANGESFRRRVLELVDATDPPVRWFVLAAEPITDVDTTAEDSLKQLIEDLSGRGVVFAFAELKHPVREHLQDYGVIDLVGEYNLYPTIGSAVHAYIDATGVDWVDWEDSGGEPETA
jgi:high affinity sulfate transporter 1